MFLVIVGALAVAQAGPTTWADSPGETAPDTYEEQRLGEVLTEEQLSSTVPAPGELVQFVRVVRHPVFMPEDPWPDFLNWAHVVTAQDVVMRELLVKTGDPYSASLVEESARNLRRAFLYALVRIEPVRDSAGALGLLVFTRDLWSLRLEQGFQVTGAQVDRLLLQLTERNVLGRGALAGVRFQTSPLTFSLGQFARDRWILGLPFDGTEAVDVTFSSRTGQPEGFDAGASLGRPLLHLAQEWGYEVGGGFATGVVRQLEAGTIATYDLPSTNAVEAIPRVWRESRASGQAALARQWQRGLVQRFTMGLLATDTQAAPNEETGALSIDEGAAFARDVLPVRRRVVGPMVAYEAFASSFRVFESLDSFGQSEPVRLGPSIVVEASGGARSMLSSSDTVLLVGALGLADDVWGGLWESAFDVVARLEDGLVVNRRFTAYARVASAELLAGRAIVDATWSLRKNDVTNALTTLGGDTGLRGFPSQAFALEDASSFIAHAEWRTRPLLWRSVHAGLVAFWDAGTLYNEDTPFFLHQSVGAGVRFLFPQFNRSVYRVDVGFPLDGPGFSFLLSLGDAQVVEVAAPSSALLPL